MQSLLRAQRQIICLSLKEEGNTVHMYNKLFQFLAGRRSKLFNHDVLAFMLI